MMSAVFDSSVYGELVLDEPFLKELAKHVNVSFAVFGSETVEEELQNTSTGKKIKEGKFKGLNLRDFLTTLYRLFTRRSETLLKTDLVEIVAARYYVAYSKEAAKSGLAKRQSKLLNDFRIVASASLRGVGIIVTADKDTMLRSEAVSAYRLVNGAFQLETPELHSYADFKRRLPELLGKAEGDENE